MTKLAPIDELARQCNAGIGYIAGTAVHPSNRTYTFTKKELAQLRQAIIRDFVSTLEPVAWSCKAIDKLAKDKFSEHITTSLEDVKYMLSGQNLAYDFEIEPLYDLSKWSK